MLRNEGYGYKSVFPVGTFPSIYKLGCKSHLRMSLATERTWPIMSLITFVPWILNLRSCKRTHYRSPLVFLWVVLVVDILNKETRRRGLAVKKRLDEVPSDLSELFEDIITRWRWYGRVAFMHSLDSCPKRPPRPSEYYHALWSGLVLLNSVDPKITNVTTSSARDSIERCIIGYLKDTQRLLVAMTQVSSSSTNRYRIFLSKMEDFKHYGQILAMTRDV